MNYPNIHFLGLGILICLLSFTSFSCGQIIEQEVPPLPVNPSPQISEKTEEGNSTPSHQPLTSSVPTNADKQQETLPTTEGIRSSIEDKPNSVTQNIQQIQVQLADLHLLLQSQTETMQQLITNLELQQKNNQQHFHTQVKEFAQSVQNLSLQLGKLQENIKGLATDRNQWKLMVKQVEDTLHAKLTSFQDSIISSYNDFAAQSKHINQTQNQQNNLKLDQLVMATQELQNTQKKIVTWQENFREEQQKQQRDWLAWLLLLSCLVIVLGIILFLAYHKIGKLEAITQQAYAMLSQQTINTNNILTMMSQEEAEWEEEEDDGIPTINNMSDVSPYLINPYAGRLTSNTTKTEPPTTPTPTKTQDEQKEKNPLQKIEPDPTTQKIDSMMPADPFIQPSYQTGDNPSMNPNANPHPGSHPPLNIGANPTQVNRPSPQYRNAYEREWMIESSSNSFQDEFALERFAKPKKSRHKYRPLYQQPASPQYIPPKGHFYCPKMITILDSVVNKLFEQVTTAEKNFPGHETGGAFIGKIQVNPLQCWEEICIEGLLSGGQNAEHQVAFFGENRESQTIELQNYQAIDDKISFLGDWHRHPDGMTHPSGGDRHTDSRNVREAITHPEKGGFIYTIICRPHFHYNVFDNQMQIPGMQPNLTTPATMPRSDQYLSTPSQDFFSRDGWKIHFYYMPSEDLHYFPFVPKVICGQMLAAPPKLGNASMHRAKAELDALKNAASFLSYDFLTPSNGQEYLCVHIHNAQKAKTMSLIIPPNYPQTAPLVYRYEKNNSIEYTSDMLQHWKPEFCLISIVYSLLPQ